MPLSQGCFAVASLPPRGKLGCCNKLRIIAAVETCFLRVQLWDLAAGKVRTVLTHHKKSVRAMCGHPREFAFLSGAADNIKKWALPDGVFVTNFTGHNSIVNAVAANADDVFVSGGDDGSLK